ncbi:MAG: hypothetical protein EA352_10910 [Gemmatimonadales bacterium]|nr:MAG: hypothetical protein EA352_10910 [Gemmatimonadales bacterium]
MDLPRRWRILRDPPSAGAWNMAVDEALARCLEPDQGILRIYRWVRPTLSFGRNQSARDRFDPHAASALGVEFVRRPTGGREVLHDRELTWSLALPLRNPDGLRGTWTRVNRALVAAVRSLGLGDAGSAGPGPAASPDAGACFRLPAEGEVMAGGRKLAGSAQRRVGNALLQHGSLLLAPSCVRIQGLGRPGKAISGQEDAAHLEELLGGPVAFDVVARAVEAALAAEYGGQWSRDDLRRDEEEVAASLQGHYESPEWTWRR